MIQVQKWLSVVTPESSEYGEVDQSLGDDLGKERLTFKELVKILKGGMSSVYPVDFATDFTWVSHYAKKMNGNTEETSIHFADIPAKSKYWVKAIKLALKK